MNCVETIAAKIDGAAPRQDPAGHYQHAARAT
jgi:hypothetical protein